MRSFALGAAAAFATAWLSDPQAHTRLDESRFVVQDGMPTSLREMLADDHQTFEAWRQFDRSESSISTVYGTPNFVEMLRSPRD